jgi:hypothetical protein
MCTPAPRPRRGAERLGQLTGEQGAEGGRAERPADLLEEHPRAAGHADVLLGDAVLRDQRDHRHEEAHAQAEHHVIDRRGEPDSADVQAGGQEQVTPFLFPAHRCG